MVETRRGTSLHRGVLSDCVGDAPRHVSTLGMKPSGIDILYMWGIYYCPLSVVLPKNTPWKSMIYQWCSNTPLFASQHPGVDVAKTRVLITTRPGCWRANTGVLGKPRPTVATVKTRVLRRQYPTAGTPIPPPYQLLHPPVATTIPPSTLIIHIIYVPPWGCRYVGLSLYCHIINM